METAVEVALALTAEVVVVVGRASCCRLPMHNFSLRAVQPAAMAALAELLHSASARQGRADLVSLWSVTAIRW